MEKTALVLGATGLVGSELLKQLLNDDRYSSVVVFVRRPLEINHPKLHVEVIDFDRSDYWSGKVKGDVLFSAFGTTIKKAKTKENQYKIDFTYQFQMAQAAKHNQVGTYVLVSSAGANPKSGIFYSRMKGELDEQVKELGFQRLVILKPSILAGNRKEKRMGEKVGLVLAKMIGVIPFISKYRSIPASTVAKAMIQSSVLPDVKDVYELAEIFHLAK
ncbi:MAG: NAD(P)H-binding protein [Salinivirgaceae bacterium]|nr:NAD(P)H-binding protein [Salinivirgaceae bacterium]